MKYNLHIDDLLTANVCLVSLLNSEQFVRFCVQHVKMVNKTSGFKANMTGTNGR